MVRIDNGEVKMPDKYDIMSEVYGDVMAEIHKAEALTAKRKKKIKKSLKITTFKDKVKK